MAYPIKIIQKKITQEELKLFLGQPFAEMVKFVVDIKKEVIALGGELHSDAEEVLLKDGSMQQDLWGANIYPHKESQEKLEYSSLINIRPSQNNFSMEIADEALRKKIKTVVEKLLPL
jgi:hypothetical protein